MIDYSEGLIRIQQLQRAAHDALNEKDWARVCDMADEIILAARAIRMHCISAMEEA